MMPRGASALAARDFGTRPSGPPDPASLDISDHSLLPRIGLKGRGACAWLERRGIATPKSPNSWRADQELLIVRLGLNEFLLEGPSAPFLDLAEIRTEDCIYPVVRQDTALALRGPGLPTLIAQTCALNIHAFDPEGRPAVLTTMADIPVLLIADLRDPVPSALIWTCRSHGVYLFETLASLAAQSGIHLVFGRPDSQVRFPQSSYLHHPQGEPL